jgi:hypothetical protein
MLYVASDIQTMTSRMIILTGLLAAASVASLGQDVRPPPIVGAIRWDAWTGGELTARMERTLGPKKYHYRLPWFAAVTNDSLPKIDGSRQAVMDREIDFAADAGLNYWAFLLDEESSAMNKALQQYMASPRRKRINFCIILHNTLGVEAARWPAERNRAIALMKQANYQCASDGRPLVFVFDALYEGEFPANRLAELKEEAKKSRLAPYFVYMGWDPEGDYARHSTKGIAAVSAYSYGGIQTNFLQLAESLENFQWQSAAKAGVPCVPLVTTGWNKQPRKDTPVPWEKDHGYHRQSVFPPAATPQEIALHLERAVTFVQTHPQVCPANAILIYAWNEYDSGGWLAPTWTPSGKPNTERLDAVAKVLKARRSVIQPR